MLLTFLTFLTFILKNFFFFIDHVLPSSSMSSQRGKDRSSKDLHQQMEMGRRLSKELDFRNWVSGFFIPSPPITGTLSLSPPKLE
jgi:hypothetical protein